MERVFFKALFATKVQLLPTIVMLHFPHRLNGNFVSLILSETMFA